MFVSAKNAQGISFVPYTEAERLKEQPMPGRLTIAFILILFVGMSIWQWMRNFGSAVGDGPQLKPSLELAAQDGTTNWQLLYNRSRLGDAQTTVLKSSSGVYILKQNVLLDGDLESFMGPLSAFAKLSGIKLNDYRAMIRTELELTYLGTMKKLTLSFVANPRPVLTAEAAQKTLKNAVLPETVKSKDKEEQNYLLRLNLVADVQEHDHLNFRGEFAFATMKFPIRDVSVKYRNKESFLSNIAPTDCMAGIRLGQRWQTPIIDPTQMMMSALATSKAKELSSGAFNTDELVKTKIAEMNVLEELKDLKWDGANVPCYLVQSNDKGTKMQIWVNATNYRVLKQSIESDRYQMEMVREPKKEE